MSRVSKDSQLVRVFSSFLPEKAILKIAPGTVNAWNLLFFDLAPFATADTFPNSFEKKTHNKLVSLNLVACNKKASDSL